MKRWSDALGLGRRTIPVTVAGRPSTSAVLGIPAPGWPGTWPEALPSPLGITIDQVYRSPDLALVGRELGPPTGSDHRPVVTLLTRSERR